MKKMLLTLASALLMSNVAISAEQPATIATVTSVQGTAVVARGDNGVAVKPGMSLHEGDKVAVLENSSVKLSYADCSISHQQNTVLDISAAAPCAQGTEYGTGVPLIGLIGIPGLIVSTIIVGAMINEIATDDKKASP